MTDGQAGIARDGAEGSAEGDAARSEVVLTGNSITVKLVGEVTEQQCRALELVLSKVLEAALVLEERAMGGSRTPSSGEARP